MAEGGVCAKEQGKYWEYHDLAFSKKNLADDSHLEVAKELKLDEEKYKACMAGKKPKEIVKIGRDQGEKIGLTGTPTLFVNGKKISGYQEDIVKKAIDSALTQ